MADYNSKYSGAQIDDGIGRALGFGLGTRCQTVTDWDTATANGWYRNTASGDAVHTPDGYAWYGHVIAYSTALVVQEVWRDVGSGLIYHCVRSLREGVWSKWDWVNPPMELGVEYRTTERYWGRPVYTKVVDCGTLPAATTKTVDPGIENARNKISVTANMYYSSTDSWSLPLHNNKYDVDLWFNNSGINIRTQQEGLTAYTCYATIKYTKTTD